MGHPGPRGVLYAKAEFLDVSHGVGVDVGVADVVVALAQFLLAGDPDLDLPEVFTHFPTVIVRVEVDLKQLDGRVYVDFTKFGVVSPDGDLFIRYHSGKDCCT